jgi:4'-phosphopantetheinyl transferase
MAPILNRELKPGIYRHSKMMSRVYERISPIKSARAKTSLKGSGADTKRVSPGAYLCAFPKKLTCEAIDIWIADVALIRWGYNKIKEILSDDERDRANRYVFERDRRSYVIRRAILRIILGRYLDLRPEQITFRYNRYGKPMLDTQDIFFSLSQSSGCAIYSFAQARQVGVDIERIRVVPDMGRIAKRSFSKAEYESYSFQTKNAKQEVFFKYWSRKEALIKAVGSGISIPLDTFDVSTNEDRPARQVEMKTSEGKACLWTIQDIDLRAGFASAVATEGPDLPVPHTHMFPSQ